MPFSTTIDIGIVPTTGPGSSGPGWQITTNSHGATVANPILLITDPGPFLITGNTTNRKIIIDDNVTADVTIQNLNINLTGFPGELAIVVGPNTGPSTLNLTVLETNTVQTGIFAAGISVFAITNATLNIYGDGTLTATAGSGGVSAGAGIGSTSNNAAGTINIHPTFSGTINATGGTTIGGQSAAGIGGGNAGGGGTITIGGGTVNATPHIGPGQGGTGGTVDVTGGELNTNPRPTISFNSQGGSTVANQQASANGNRLANFPTNPTRGTDTFNGWWDTSAATGGNQITAGASGTVFTNNATVYARWAANQAPSITTHPTSQTVQAGSSVTFNAAATGTPAPDFQWQISTNGGATFTSISGETSGTLTLNNVTTAMSGYQYRVLASIGNLIIQSNAATLTVTEQQQPATYTVNRATASTVPAANMTITPSGAQTAGTAMTVTITPPSGQRIVAGSIAVTGVPSITPTANGATFPMPTSGGEIIVNANFEQIPQVTRTITATAGSGGSISPSGSVSINNGASQAFTITADSGFEINDVTVNGSSVGAVNSYTFSNVTANHTIHATFRSTAPSGGYDYTPSPNYGSLSPNNINFDLANPSNITVTFHRGDFTFQNAIRFGTGTNAINLVRDRDFTATANNNNTTTITIMAEWLSEHMTVGTRHLTFIMSGGNTLSFRLNVTDTSPTLDPTPTTPSVQVDLSPALTAELMERLGDRFDNLDVIVTSDIAQTTPQGAVMGDIHGFYDVNVEFVVRGKTMKSVLISCGARLAPFDIAEIREITRYDELELDTLGDEKTALFFIISDTDSSFNFLVSMAYTQLFNLLCTKADDTYGGRLPVHVRCLIDECANIGQIPNLEKLMATIRSREISACLVLQAQSQLKALYKDNASTIVGNCDSAIFLGGKEKDTLEEWSKLLGKETIDSANTTETKGNSPSYGRNFNKLGRDLMSMDELAVMHGSDCILQVRGVRPFLSKKYDITKHPHYKYLADYDKRNAFNVEKYLSTKLRVKPDDVFIVHEIDMDETLPADAFIE